MTEEYRVNEADTGKRIDVFLSEYADISRSDAARMLSEGAVLVNGKEVAKSYKLSVNDTVTFEKPEVRDSDVVPEDIPLDVMYEDDSVIVINKKKGMVVHPAAGHYSGTLVNALLYRCKDSLSGIGGVMRPGIVHRIDKDTSGLLVVAKNDNAHTFLSDLLKSHDVRRIYYAVVVGTPREGTGTVNKPIGRHKTDRKRMAVYTSSDGDGIREAVTHYRVLCSNHGYSLVKFRLETGRTHQIRVHMSSIGHPIIGDTVYGGGRTKFETVNASLLCGQCLHAKRLEFIHPDTREFVRIESEFPDYFKTILSKLEMKDYVDADI